MVDASDDVDGDVDVSTHDATPEWENRPSVISSGASNDSSNDSSGAHRLHQGGYLSNA